MEELGNWKDGPIGARQVTEEKSDMRFQIRSLLPGGLMLDNSHKCFTPYTASGLGVMSPRLQRSI